MALTEVPIELSSAPGIVDNSTGTAITIDASGNTGIRETNPIVPLHVLDETGATSLLGNVAATFRTGSASNPVNIQFSDETSAANVGMAAGDLFFATGSTGRMRITSNGSVGINTDSPAAGGGGLHVNGGTSGTPATSGTTQNGALRLSSDATSGILDFGMNGANPWIQATDSGGLNNNYNILLNPNGGNVGIGTDSPAAKLHLDSASTTAILFDSDTSTQQYELGVGYGGVGTSAFYLYDNTASATRLVVDPSGRLLVGTDTVLTGNKHCFVDSSSDTTVAIQENNGAGTLPLAIWNTATTGDNLFVNFYTEGSATERGSIDYNRTGGQVRYNVTSDQRLKENIVDAPSASDDIDAIQVRSFDWIENGYHQSYGLVAQELLTVVPDAVRQPEDPDEMMGVDYSKLVPMMLKEIQSLRARVAQLEGAN
jgi:hypothetical protein